MDDFRSAFEPLMPEIDEIRVVKLTADSDLYHMLIRASFVKAFDFAYWATHQDKQPGISFWAVGTLRGIIEDVIVLTAILKVPSQDRNHILKSWMSRDIFDGLKKQAAFFSRTERLQTVLQPSIIDEEDIATLRQDMRLLWKNHGFNPGRSDKGNIRELARASDLEELYDFLYSLASRLVHFSPSVLLRSGWGHFQDDALIGEFRATHFNNYYQSVIINYSILLLVEHIERLGPRLQLSNAFYTTAKWIRESLVKVRMPELITYEEMNIDPPNILIRAVEAGIRSRDVTISDK